MAEGRSRRRRRSRDQWREIVRRGEASGLSVEAHCAAESVSTASYYLWRRRLGRERGVEEGAPEPSPRFVELGALAAPGGWEVALELGGEVVLRIRRG